MNARSEDMGVFAKLVITAMETDDLTDLKNLDLTSVEMNYLFSFALEQSAVKILNWLFNEKKEFELTEESFYAFCGAIPEDSDHQPTPTAFICCLPTILNFLIKHNSPTYSDFFSSAIHAYYLIEDPNETLGNMFKEKIIEVLNTESLHDRGHLLIALFSSYLDFDRENAFFFMLEMAKCKELSLDVLKELLKEFLQMTVREKFILDNFSKLINFSCQIDELGETLIRLTPDVKEEIEKHQALQNQQKISIYAVTVDTFFSNHKKGSGKSQYVLCYENVLTTWYQQKIAGQHFNENDFNLLLKSYCDLAPKQSFEFYFGLLQQFEEIEAAFSLCQSHINAKDACDEIARINIANLLFLGLGNLAEKDSPLNEYIHNEQQKRWVQIIQAYYIIKDCKGNDFVLLKQKFHQILAEENVSVSVQTDTKKESVPNNWNIDARRAYLSYQAYKQNPHDEETIMNLKIVSEQDALIHHENKIVSDKRFAGCAVV